MRLPMLRAAVVLLGLPAVVCLWASGCNDRTTNPPPPPEASKDYPVYFADLTAPVCYRYRVVTGTLDTVALPFIATAGLDISPDGTTLYAAGADEVIALDLATGASDVIWPGCAKHGLTVSPDGRYLAWHGDELDIIELSTQTVVHHEAEGTFRGVFSADSRRYYAPTERCQIIQISLAGSGTTSHTSFPNRCYGRIAVSENENRWYLYDLGPCYGRHDVYDLSADSVIFSTYFRPGMGNLELAPNEMMVFFTSPGPVEDMCWPYSGDYTIAVYDADQNQLADEISTRNISTAKNVVDSTLVNELVATPDSRWLIGLSLRGDIVRVDLERLEITSFSRFDAPRPIAQYPCCQTNL